LTQGVFQKKAPARAGFFCSNGPSGREGFILLSSHSLISDWTQ